MLATRIIPTLLHRGETLVKGKMFDSWRSVGHVQQAARIYASRGVDELCILNIARELDVTLVEKLTSGNFCPITIGGGIRSLEDATAMFRAGADKVAVCTGGPELISRIADRYGCQAVVAAIDVRGDFIATECGTKVMTLGAVEAAVMAEKAGAGEILLTDIRREGMMEGYNLGLIMAVSMEVGVPVIAHGGCGSYEHMLQAIEVGADAVAAGALFQFTDSTPRDAAEWLKEKGVEVRI